MNSKWVMAPSQNIVHSDAAALSPLDLLHPNGRVTSVRVFGANCPPRLVPPGCDLTADQANLVLWAPTGAECQLPEWLEQSASLIKNSLADNGLVYALVPRRWRLKALLLMQKQGLEVDLSFLHLPDWFSSRYFVPLQWRPARYAFTKLFPTRAPLRAGALGLLSFPYGNRLLSLLVPTVGFTARRPGSQKLFNWLFQWVGTAPDTGSVVMGASWKGDQCSIMLQCFTGGDDPCMAAKTILTEPGHFENANEFYILTQLRERAHQAGARIPEPISIKKIGDNQLFLQSVVPGKSASTILSGHPDQIPVLIRRILDWLEPWNRATAIYQQLDPLCIEHEIMLPFDQIAPFLSNADDYHRWLSACCSQINIAIPFTDAHNDLTSWNILLEPGSPLGIVDWREASPAGLPLQDFFYMVVDVVSTARGCGQEAAFLDCISPAGKYFNLFSQFLERMKHALGLTAPVVNLCLHTCFLHHAANEQHERAPQEDHPFLGIVRWLEKNRSAFLGQR